MLVAAPADLAGGFLPGPPRRIFPTGIVGANDYFDVSRNESWRRPSKALPGRKRCFLHSVRHTGSSVKGGVKVSHRGGGKGDH